MEIRVFFNLSFYFLFFSKVYGLGEGIVDVNAILGIFNGVANVFAEVNTTDIAVHQILGKWHLMYKSGVNFDVYQASMYCQVAYVTRNKVMGQQGFSIEEAFHVGSKYGPITALKRDCEKVGPGEYWMYTEEYFYPRQFYILKTGPEKFYSSPPPSSKGKGNDTINSPTVNETTIANKERLEYLVATDSNRLALMVYARDPTEYLKLYDKQVLAALNKQGFGGYAFWNQPVAIYQGSDCYYPSATEIFVRRSLRTGGNGVGGPSSEGSSSQPVLQVQPGVQVPTGANAQPSSGSAASKVQTPPATSLSNLPALPKLASLSNKQQEPAFSSLSLSNSPLLPNLASLTNNIQQPSGINNLPLLTNNIQQPSGIASLPVLANNIQQPSGVGNLPALTNNIQQPSGIGSNFPTSVNFFQPPQPNVLQQINQIQPSIANGQALQQAIFDPEQIQLHVPLTPHRVQVQVPLVPYRFPRIQFPSIGSLFPYEQGLVVNP